MRAGGGAKSRQQRKPQRNQQGQRQPKRPHQSHRSYGVRTGTGLCKSSRGSRAPYSRQRPSSCWEIDATGARRRGRFSGRPERGQGHVTHPAPETRCLRHKGYGILLCSRASSRSCHYFPGAKFLTRFINCSAPSKVEGIFSSDPTMLEKIIASNLFRSSLLFFLASMANFV